MKGKRTENTTNGILDILGTEANREKRMHCKTELKANVNLRFILLIKTPEMGNVKMLKNGNTPIMIPTSKGYNPLDFAMKG